MTDQSKTTLACVGCERPAPASAKPEPCGNWACRACIGEMKWAMAWMDRIWPKGGPVVVLGETT